MNFPVIRDRMEIIAPLIQGKSVLDLGCVDHDVGQIQGNWLHRELKKWAREVVGVDYLPEAVQKLRSMGFNVVCQDVEALKLERKFDVVVAGELIEHLANPGLFLKGVFEHLKEDGIFIFSTPNPFSIAQFFRILKRNRIKVNFEHKMWFDPKTIRVLLKGSGFETRQIYWINRFNKFSLKSFISRFRLYFHDAFLVICFREHV